MLPGRNPFVVAKQWATLDRLSSGRCLPAFGLGVAEPREQAAFGVERKERAARFDELLPKVRRLWAGEEVDGATVAPRPVQDPLDVWLGGIAPSELRRVGRLGDGWLPSFCTPEDVAAARPVVEAEASAHGRTFDPEHWGALIPYLPVAGALPDLLVAAVAARRPDVDAARIVPAGLDAVRDAHRGLRRRRRLEVRARPGGRARRLGLPPRRGRRRRPPPRELTRQEPARPQRNLRSPGRIAYAP